jgi:hypothetical protein
MIIGRLHKAVFEVHASSIARCDCRADHNAANWCKAVQSSDLVRSRLREDYMCRGHNGVLVIMPPTGSETKICHLNALYKNILN